MTVDAATLESYWSVALTRLTDAAFRTIALGTTTPHGPLLAAVDAGGRRHLLVPIDAKHTLAEDVDGRAVTLRRRVLEDASSYRAYAALELVDEGLSDLFTALCVEIVERIAATPTKAVAALRSALADWKALLAGARRTLTPSALAGLFGELWMLRAMTARDPGAVAFWTGHSGTAQDFHKVPDAVEVKTTTAPEGRTVRIHGVGQLDPVPGGRLVLTWLRLRTDQGWTVPALVDDLLATTDDPALLLASLRAVGYHHADREVYARRPFDVVEQRSYRVGPGFPRIVPAGLIGDAALAGLDTVHYDVDLDSAAAEASRLTSDPITEFLGRA